MAFFNGWPWANFQEQNLDWLIKRVNQIPKEIPQQIREIIKEMGYDPEAQYKDFYNVKDYGAVGDGATDDWEAIQNILTIAKNNGGGTVFLPAGVYNISKTLIVGDNCYLMGTGAGSVINCIMVHQFWGTAIGVVGSNSGVLHLKANYYDPNPLPIAQGPAHGAIGITNCVYSDAVEQHRGPLLPAIKNIMIDDVTTDGNYLLQCEPVSRIDNVIYNNIKCPQAMVSVTGGTAYGDSRGELYNILVNDVICGFLRISYSSYGSDVAVNNASADFAFLTGYNLIANNLQIHPKETSNYARAESGSPTIANLVIIPSGSTRPIKLSNVSVYGADYTNGIGIKTQIGSGYVLMTNVSSAGHNVNIDNSTGQILGSNCVFDEQIGDTNTVNGLFVNSKLGASFTGSAKNVYQLNAGDIVYSSGISATGGWSNNKVIQNGQVVKLFARVSGSFTDGSTLFTTSLAPTMTTQVIIWLYSSSAPTNWIPALATWNTTGAVIINNVFSNVSQYDTAVIDIMSM